MADYLITFLSIIAGYVVTQFFEGWKIIILDISPNKLYWLHIGWTIFMFIFIIEIWWVFGSYRQKIYKIFFFFLLTLFPFLLLYLAANFILPDSAQDLADTTFKVFYDEKSTKMYFLFTLIGILSTIVAPFFFNENSFLTIKTLMRLILSSLFFIAIFYHEQIYEIIVFILSWIFLLIFIIKYRFNAPSLPPQSSQPPPQTIP